MAVHWAHGGPSGKSEAGGGGSTGEGGRQVQGLKHTWRPLRAGLPCCHTGSLLTRAAPDAFCTEGNNFLLVWQAEVSRLLQGRSCFVFLQNNYFYKIWYWDQKDVSSGMLLEASAPHLSELRSAFVSKCILHPCEETPFVINYPVWPYEFTW